MNPWLTEMAFSSLRSLGGSILTSLGPAGVIAVLAGGLLMMAVPVGLIRFVSRPRGMALAAAVMLGGLAMMFRGSTPAASPQRPPVPENGLEGLDMTPPAAPPVAFPGPPKFVRFERSTPKEDMSESVNAYPYIPPEFLEGVTPEMIAARKREKEGDFKARLATFKQRAKQEDAYCSEHGVHMWWPDNGYCIHCKERFKVPEKGRQSFMPCPKCGKEAVTKSIARLKTMYGD